MHEFVRFRVKLVKWLNAVTMVTTMTTGILITVIMTLANFKDFLKCTHVHTNANSECKDIQKICKKYVYFAAGCSCTML
jgi:hypothetical protein